jgi:hypothetical protein
MEPAARISSDPGLSAAKRRALRGREAKEAIADHEEAQRAFHGNRERLREERLAREAACGANALSFTKAVGRHAHRKRPIFYEDPERANHRGLENVGQIREASDTTLLNLQDLGKGLSPI